jgi:crotonobetainyl-CoA:carnitine CoA-transferase CaiB-like acyl-CoA transferase
MPLEGLRVLDLSRLLPGGYCTLLLADLGADVIKVEDLQAGDYLRTTPPLEKGVGMVFRALNRNKRAIRLDLKHPDGRAAFLRLAADSDVVVDGFRPGVLDRLGVGYAALAASNPRVIYCALTGYGQTGPWKGRAGHDLNYIALAGILAQTGNPAGLAIPGTQIADFGGGLGAAFAILAALWGRERGGHGQAIDMSLLDLAVGWSLLELTRTWAGEPSAPAGGGRLTGGFPCYRLYRAQDGDLSVAALEPRFWQALCATLGRPDLERGQFAEGRDAEETVAALAAIFATRTRAQWVEALAGADACVEPVLQVEEVLSHPQVRARSQRRGPGLGLPFRLSALSPRPSGPAPGPGEHTDLILGAVGYTQEQLARLRAAGAIG